jgi:hypothetical protein
MPQHFTFHSLYQLMGQDMSYPHFYGGLQETALQLAKRQRMSEQAAYTEINRAVAEAAWHACGKPYYRLTNEVIELFRHVALDIPARYIVFPYPAFTLHLPCDNPLRGCHGRQVRSVLVAESLNDRGQRTAYLWCDLGEQETIPPHLPVLNYIHMPLSPEQPIGEAIGALPEDSETGSDLTINDLDQQLVRLAVTVSFLATGSDRLIRPDVLSKDLQSWLTAVRDQNTQQQQMIVERAARRKGRGFVVDLEHERQFLRSSPVTHDDADEAAPKYSLTHSHLRAAHFRHLPRSDRVIFIRPTIVRPDLPTH